MPYWQIVTASFRIPWRHRYLWLLALFAGESGAGANFNYGSGNGFRTPAGGSTPNPGQVTQQAGTWLQDHFALVVALVIAWIVLVILFFILAAVCEAAVVRAAAEHDADRPFGLGAAWRSGVNRMGSMIRFRLLLFVLGLPALVVLIALIAGAVLAAANNHPGAAVALGILAALAGLAAIVYFIYLGFLDRLGSRALVLEQLQGWPSIARGHVLLRKRLGRTLLVWLLSIAVGIAVGLSLGIGLVILALPAIAIAVGAAASGAAGLWVIFALYVLLVVAVAIVASSYVAAQSSAYWTLAFRRLDIDYPPAYHPVAYPPAAPSQ